MKTRNYWKYLKAKLRREGNELVSATTQLKLTAADGKRYRSDALDANGVVALAKNFNIVFESMTDEQVSIGEIDIQKLLADNADSSEPYKPIYLAAQDAQKYVATEP